MSREGTIINRGRLGTAYSAEGWLNGAGPLKSNTLVSARLDADSVQVCGPLLRDDVLPWSLAGRADSQSLGYFVDGVGEAGAAELRTWENQGASGHDAAFFWYPTNPSGTGTIATGGRSLYFSGSGTAGNYLSTPDNAALDLTTLDIRCLVTATAWRTAAGTNVRRIVSKRDGATSSYEFYIADSGANSGRLVFAINGGAQTATSSVAIPFQNNQAGWIRVTHISGSTKFYWAPVTSYSTAEPTVWYQLGATQTGVVTAITNSTAALGIGAIPTVANPFAGYIHVVNIYNSVGGTFGTSGHIVNLDIARDAATADSTTTVITSPRPTLGTTWTFTLTRVSSAFATFTGPLAPPAVPGSSEFRVSNTSNVEHYDDFPADDSFVRTGTSFIAWARINTTTMPTIADGQWLQLFGCKEGEGAVGPGWAVFMKSDRTVKFEIYNETFGSVATASLACPNNADVILLFNGMAGSTGYQLSAYLTTDLTTAAAQTSSSSYGTATSLSRWSYIPPFRFADPAEFIPITSVGYIRLPTTRNESSLALNTNFLKSITGTETYVDGDTFVSNVEGVFEGLIISPGDLLVATSSGATPTWIKKEMTVTPAWTAVTSSDVSTGTGVAIQQDITIAPTEDFTVWSVFSVKPRTAEVINWLPVFGFYGGDDYFECGLYEDTGDMYVYVDLDSISGDQGDIDQVLLLPIPSDITDPIFVAWTLDRANGEHSVCVNDEYFTSALLNPTDPLNWDDGGSGFNGWTVDSMDNPGLFQLWGVGARWRHYNATAMEQLRISALNYLRPRTAEPEFGFDGSFGDDPFGESPFGG